jgi:hypothetical protein
MFVLVVIEEVNNITKIEYFMSDSVILNEIRFTTLLCNKK